MGCFLVNFEPLSTGVVALTFLLQHGRVFDVELVSKLAKTLFEHHHQVVLGLRDDCHSCPPDTDAFAESSAR